ncbi:hypothetical protein [Bacillus sp. OK048]|uniref:hypothetical protein n=1 Tax=Bacillus sp. OK048 TaxID=1882761 RepID=UPI0008889650|nr:hypothetical protein [Bacillus sp. OK048]SDM41674.1 hypothetical protein SAMN05443253_103238 [Bacillus sp. OK048]
MNQIEKAMKQAESSLRIEGIILKEEQKKLVKSLLNNEISEEEFQKKVKELLK